LFDYLFVYLFAGCLFLDLDAWTVVNGFNNDSIGVAMMLGWEDQ